MGLRQLFESYDKKVLRSHFKHLYAVARADGDVESEEVELLIRLAEKFHMPGSEVTAIIKNPESVTDKTPKSRRERIEHLYDLVTVMLVDDRIDERELVLCKSFASKLGVLDNDVDPMVRDLIEKAMRGEASEKAVEETLIKYR
ncbi:hypothetical protein [Robiginitalea sp. SC105]|uniref:hypothetical protein n=1 Tax=Robiginitalea sp. SC105 TaxID=2762332 RepID=UPI00163AEA16|nr:hypothetical protein [Robiginitalea sp. SC105]MBC2838135.1 hypothetical protein [Robiginitalea sp. SC105]